MRYDLVDVHKNTLSYITLCRNLILFGFPSLEDRSFFLYPFHTFWMFQLLPPIVFHRVVTLWFPAFQHGLWLLQLSCWLSASPLRYQHKLLLLYCFQLFKSCIFICRLLLFLCSLFLVMTCNYFHMSCQ